MFLIMAKKAKKFYNIFSQFWAFKIEGCHTLYNFVIKKHFPETSVWNQKKLLDKKSMT